MGLTQNLRRIKIKIAKYHVGISLVLFDQKFHQKSFKGERAFKPLPFSGSRARKRFREGMALVLEILGCCLQTWVLKHRKGCSRPKSGAGMRLVNMFLGVLNIDHMSEGSISQLVR